MDKAEIKADAKKYEALAKDDKFWEYPHKWCRWQLGECPKPKPRLAQMPAGRYKWEKKRRVIAGKKRYMYEAELFSGTAFSEYWLYLHKVNVEWLSSREDWFAMSDLPEECHHRDVRNYILLMLQRGHGFLRTKVKPYGTLYKIEK